MAFLLIDLIVQPIESAVGFLTGGLLRNFGTPLAKIYLASCLTYGTTNWIRTKDQPPDMHGGMLFSIVTMPIAPFYYFVFPWLARVYFLIDRELLSGKLPRGAPDWDFWKSSLPSSSSS